MKTQFEIWLDKVNEERKEYWDNNYSYKEYEPLITTKGRKFMKIYDGTSIWGFVSMFEGEHKGVPIKKGDLMMPASWQQAAKHSRGNIFEGTDSWTFHGPSYRN